MGGRNVLKLAVVTMHSSISPLKNHCTVHSQRVMFILYKFGLNPTFFKDEVDMEKGIKH